MLAENFAQIFAGLHSFDHRLERINQLKDSDLAQAERRRRIPVESARLTKENSFAINLPYLQLRGGFLEFLIFDQLPDQVPPGIILFRIFLRRLLIGGKRTAALE